MQMINDYKYCLNLRGVESDASISSQSRKVANVVSKFITRISNSDNVYMIDTNPLEDVVDILTKAKAEENESEFDKAMNLLKDYCVVNNIYLLCNKVNT